MLAGKGPIRPPQKRKVSKAIGEVRQQAALGFKVNDSGVGGVIGSVLSATRRPPDSSDQARRPFGAEQKLEVPKERRRCFGQL